MSDICSIIKVTVIGDSNAGKSSFVRRIVSNTFTTNTGLNTIGIDFESTVITHNGERYKLQIWDTAGQERFRSIISSYFRNTNVILVFFDVTSKESFLNIDYWLNMAYDNSTNVILIGNKCDMDYKMNLKEISNYVNKKKVPYFETSAKTNYNIKTVTDYIISTIVENNIDLKKAYLPTVINKKDSCC